jgi:hypothetical protein
MKARVGNGDKEDKKDMECLERTTLNRATLVA